MDNMKKDLIKLHKDYTRLYQDGLIGVSTNYIQVTPELFSDLKGDDKIEIVNDGTFVELSFKIGSTRVITLI